MKPFPAVAEGPEMAAPAISPDGHWMAYISTDSGRRQVYVRRFPEGEGRWLVSSDTGTQPMWARSGRELFYRDGERMMAVAVTTQPTFRAERARLLFEGHYEGAAVRAAYDVMPDGEHFVMVKAAEPQPANKQINIVLHWIDS
jgi:serine/threonine-protein kinase